MCGRFTVRTSPQEVARLFRTAGVPPNCPPRYNLAPTQDALVVRFNREDGLRHLDLLRWGLIPLWAKDKKIGSTMINARCETIATKAAFREAFDRRRCLVPADGFYEWKKLAAKQKQAFAIMPTDSPLFAFAGLWDRWKDAATGEILRSFTIITGPANDLMQSIHDRMPVILEEANWAKWLGQEPANQDELRAMLKPYPAERMRAYEISDRVNSPKFDDATILDPL